MVLLGKIALGFGAATLMAGAYTFRQGVIRVDVDENHNNGSHVHVPLLHTVAKELEKYPEATFVDVQDGQQHAVVRTHYGSLTIDVDSPDEHVHVKCPLATIDDVAEQLAEAAPKA